MLTMRCGGASNVSVRAQLVTDTGSAKDSAEAVCPTDSPARTSGDHQRGHGERDQSGTSEQLTVHVNLIAAQSHE